MTSVGWPELTGRRRRHRPVMRTVRFPPLSAAHSTASIDTADDPGSSLILRDGTSPGGRIGRARGPKSRSVRALRSQLFAEAARLGQQALRLAQIGALRRLMLTGDRQLRPQSLELGAQPGDLAGRGVARHLGGGELVAQ